LSHRGLGACVQRESCGLYRRVARRQLCERLHCATVSRGHLTSAFPRVTSHTPTQPVATQRSVTTPPRCNIYRRTFYTLVFHIIPLSARYSYKISDKIIRLCTLMITISERRRNKLTSYTFRINYNTIVPYTSVSPTRYIFR
jgi:hypothetical protein